jgi:hypothetical protein
LFVFDLLVTPEMGELIVSFVVCGMGLMAGLTILRRLLPRREPETLFGGSCGLIAVPIAQPDIPAQTKGRSRNVATDAAAIPGESQALPIGHSERYQTISRYKTPEGGGLIGLVAMVGMAIMLMIGSNFARQFLSLAVPAGGVIALVLYWARRGNLD